jgi:uncharacterized membrane protein
MPQEQKDIRERKRQKFAQSAAKKPSSTRWIVAGGVLLVVLLSVWLRARGGDKTTADAGDLPVRDGAVRLPVSTFDDREAHHYTYHADGADIQFFVLKSSDGVIRAAFSACDVCFLEKQGYRQEGDEMICNNCGQRFPSELINEVRGGCNPSPIDRTIEGGEVVILIDDILAGAGYF